MQRTSMGTIVSASAALVGTAALVVAGCSPSGPAAAPPPALPTLDAAVASQGTQASSTPVDPANVEELWAPVAAAAAVGGYTAWGTVVDAQTGQVLLDAEASTPHTPASTTKTLAAFTALAHLDPTATLTTSALLGADSHTLYLDSEGDLLLGIGASETREVPGRAGLQTLADDTASVLAQRGVTSVTLDWRGTLFEGASHLSSWDAQEVGAYEGEVGPMAIDAGRTYEGANDFYSDSPARVAQVFAQALGAAGINAPLGEAGEPPAGAAALATVSSATMGEQLRWMLAHSDNTLADQYCRFAARAAGAPATYEGATSTVASTLSAAGVPTEGLFLEDCSGLSSNDRISANTLVGVLKASYSGQGTSADTMRLLPWAGLVGTLSKRMTEEPAAGNVQAKTGALQEVTSLSGSVITRGGRVLLVSIGHDQVTAGALATRGRLDAFEEGLAGLN